MGVNSGKFYDAKKMQAYCDMMKKSASNYNDKADLAHSDYNGFHITEKFMGMTADEMKTFIKGGVGGTLKVVSEAHRKMRKSQEDVITMFETMVDKSQHARIEYDTLEMINNFYKNLYFELKDRADSVKKLVDGLNDEFGNYAYFEQPDSQSALDAFIDFCGGESDSAGYIRDCQNKFVAFDEAAKAYLKGTDTVDRAIKVDTNIVNCATALSAPMENKGTGAKFELLSVKNVKPKGAKDTPVTALLHDAAEALNGMLSNVGDPDETFKKTKKILYGSEMGSWYYEEANNLIAKYNLTDAQKEYIDRLKELEGYTYTYCDSKGNEQKIELKSERVASMQVAAAALFEFGKSPEFVSGVLGNIAFEGGAGHIEDSNYKDGEPYYLRATEQYFEDKKIVAPKDAKMITEGEFDKHYADERIYSISDSKKFLKKLNQYRDKTDSDNICGIGICQWTTKDRLDDLLPLYEEGDYTFSDIVQAEATMLVNELSGEFDNDVDGVDDFCENNYSSLDYENEVRKDAEYFYENYEMGATETKSNRADVAYDIYEKMMEE